MNFWRVVRAAWAQGKFLCVALDIPEFSEGMCEEIVHATKDVACAYKINPAFFLGDGDMVGNVIDIVDGIAPDIPVILDGKWGDVRHVNERYAAAAFDVWGADAVTVSPYYGMDALEPFFRREDRGVFVLCRGSAKGRGGIHAAHYISVAREAGRENEKYRNIGLVIGATDPDAIRSVRDMTDMPLLIPGIGPQGGHIGPAVIAARGKNHIPVVGREIVRAAESGNLAAVCDRLAREAAFPDIMKAHGEKVAREIVQAVRGG